MAVTGVSSTAWPGTRARLHRGAGGGGHGRSNNKRPLLQGQRLGVYFLIKSALMRLLLYLPRSISTPTAANKKSTHDPRRHVARDAPPPPAPHTRQLHDVVRVWTRGGTRGASGCTGTAVFELL